MSRVHLITATALLAAATCSLAAPPASTGTQMRPSSASPAAAVPDNALKLSRLVNPEDRIFKVGMAGFQLGIDAELKRSPESAAVYDKNPGLLEAVVDAGRPVMRKHLVAVIPEQQRRFAQFYAAKFSPEEIDQLIGFYSSPTGMKVLEAMYDGIDLGAIVQASAKDASKTLSADDVGKLNAAATAGLPDKFDAEDWKALFIFSAAPVHAKLVRLTPEFNQLVADVENENDAALDEDMTAAIRSAVAVYFAKGEKKPAH